MPGTDTDGTKRCLDLFAGLHGFSQAFHDHPDWEVVTVDITETFERELELDPWGIETMTVETRVPKDYVIDIRDLDARMFDNPEFDVVLASPPCTTYSLMAISDHRTADYEAATEKAEQHDQLLYHVFNLIRELDPEFWFLENPRAILRKKEPFGEPQGTVTWCQYGEAVMKPTDLWGRHPVMEYAACQNGADCHLSASRGSDSGTQGVGTSAERARLPEGLSEAILDAVESGAVVEQVGLTNGFEPVAAHGMDSPDGQKPYCPTCKTERDEWKCSACGEWLYEPTIQPVSLCLTCHMPFYPGDDDAVECGVCRGAREAVYGWDHGLCACAGSPGRTDECAGTPYRVPENYTALPAFQEEEVHETKDGHVSKTFIERAYRCQDCGHTARAKRRRIDEQGGDSLVQVDARTEADSADAVGANTEAETEQTTFGEMTG